MKIKLLFLTILLYSCNRIEEDCDNYSYNCNTTEPYEWSMKIQITINNQNKKVPIWIYEGKFNDTSKLVYIDTFKTTDEEVILPLNHYYYIKAKYNDGNRIIYAIDGVFFKKYSRTVCDSICWYIKNDRLDVRLK